jgi:hypothetical protein
VVEAGRVGVGQDKGDSHSWFRWVPTAQAAGVRSLIGT